ncbi:MAG TPA: hypothetical protein VIF62_25350 [Labilithrix sp.]|jgi:hypothetical protein
MLATAFGAVLVTATAARADGPPASTSDAETAAITSKSSQADGREQDTVMVYRKIRPNRAWLITGGLVLTGSYATTAAFAIQSDHTQDKTLLIPIVGPWVNLADRQCSGCANETRNEALVIGSGILQAIGTGFIVTGFLVPEKIEAATIQVGSVRMNIAPTQTPGGMGALAVGTF